MARYVGAEGGGIGHRDGGAALAVDFSAFVPPKEGALPGAVGIAGTQRIVSNPSPARSRVSSQSL